MQLAKERGGRGRGKGGLWRMQAGRSLYLPKGAGGRPNVRKHDQPHDASFFMEH